MSFPDTAGRRFGKTAVLWLLFTTLMAGLGSTATLADEPSIPPAAVESPEVWLVTYGPGEIYWQRFGHNAIWIRDSGLGLDHVFNFGFFDFEQENFLLRFLQGRLLYFSAAVPAQQEFAQYIDENRSIRAQRLALSPVQALSLTEFLINEVQPENRDYLYDYYWNNCSTRVRDVLDHALGGSIGAAFTPLAANQDLRDHTRRLTIADYWFYIGLEIGLGSPIDRPISRWDEFFIPGELADGLAVFTQGSGLSANPLVAEDIVIFQSTLAAPPGTAATWWPRYLLAAVALLVLAIAASRVVPALRPLRLSRFWLLLSGCMGLVIGYLWFFTDHAAAGNNLNLALFNPLWLLCLVGRRWLPICAWLLIGLGVLALVMMLLPPHQYMADVLAATLPLNIAAALVLLKFRQGSAPEL